MKIEDYILEKIAQYGAHEFYDRLSQGWTSLPAGYNQEVLDIILEDIKSKFKPQTISTIEDVAKVLDGNTYGDELKCDFDIEKICKDNNWVIMFPYSDDNVELRGAIDDEISAWEGINLKFYKEGDLYADPDEDNTYHKALETCCIEDNKNPDVMCKWCDEKYDAETHKTYTWNYIVTNPKLPHIYFNIVDEDDEEDSIWAKCVVIDLNEL